MTATVLLLGIGLVGYGEWRPLREPRFKGKLADMLPTTDEVPGWVIEPEEIARTPEMKRAVAEMLNFDDAVFVSYLSGSDRISVYLAHWNPGRISHRLIAGHTPDVCWVGNGWEVVERHHDLELPIRGVPPAEHRKMRFQGRDETVLFWHLVGGEVHSYNAPCPPWYAMFTDTWQRRCRQREEQLFVRVSSPLPASRLSTNMVVLRFFANLCRSNTPL